MTPNPLTELADLAEWCRIEREKLGAIDGYDYRSGEEFGLRRAQNEIESRIAGTPDPGSMNERRIAEDTRLASNVREALKPFATFGIGEGGEDIRDGLMRDRICDWFGPSDFDAARNALSTTGKPKR